MQLDDDDEKLQEENDGTPSSTPPLVTATTTSSRQHQQQQQTPNQNVGELVVKAKKAAASLWMILHAQVSYLNVMLCHFFMLCP